MPRNNRPSHTYLPGPSHRRLEEHQKHGPRRPRLSKYQRSDLNEGNQDDPHYTSLRARANEEGDKMARCIVESKHAYEAGDRDRAKTLSNERKAHKAKMDQLNLEAGAWIYAKNNEDSAPGEIDLHGLYVPEAVKYSGRAIEAAQSRGDATINLIVGKGLHSDDGVAKLRPAIKAMVQKRKLVAELDPDNAGVLIVQLGRKKSENRVTSPSGVTRNPANVLPPAEVLAVRSGKTKPKSRVTGVSKVTHNPVVRHDQHSRVTSSPGVSYSQYDRVTHSPVVPHGRYNRVTPNPVVPHGRYIRVTPSPVVSYRQYGQATIGPPAVTAHVRRGYPIILGVLTFFNFIELAIAATLVSMFNEDQNQPSGAVNDRARYLLFNSVWSAIGSSLLMVLFLLFGGASGPFTSISVHLIYLTLTWVSWTAGAGAITAVLGGGPDCNLDYTYCGQLNALEVFAWIPWILTTIVVVATLLKPISSHRQSDGWHGQFV